MPKESKRKLGVRLATSKRMGESSSEKENRYIRMPHRARVYFQAEDGDIKIEVNGNVHLLKVTNAYREDVEGLRKAVKSGKIKEELAAKTGFVTASTMARLSGRKRSIYTKECYVSKSVENLTLGADPEFALVNKENLRYQYAKHILGEEGELGSDGPLAEVRPPPGTTVDDVVNTIKNILLRDGSKIGKFNWMAGATYRSPNHEDERVVHIGGHIHIGDPVELPNEMRNGVYSQITRVLDETIALPLVRIDCPEPYLRRNTAWKGYGKYGRWGDQKTQEGRFEWRVPSGLWLAHPDLAYSILSTTKALSETCYQMMADKKFDNNWVCQRADRTGFLKKWGAMNANEAKKIINGADPRDVSTTLINRAAKKLQSMDNYKKYKDGIDEFLCLVRMPEKDLNKLNLDIKKNWLEKGKLLGG